MVDALAAGQQPATKDAVNALNRAKEKGHVERRPDGWVVVPRVNRVAFIPNSFVRAREGVSPLGRLVTHGELGPVMLAAQLYGLQDLMEERGVPIGVLRSYFHAYETKRIGLHRLHYLKAGRDHKETKKGRAMSFTAACEPRLFPGYDQAVFWPNLVALEANHVVEWAVYSANGKPVGDERAYNRPQRPLGVLRNGKQHLDAPESEVAFGLYVLSRCAQGHISAPWSHAMLDQLLDEWLASGSVIALENQSVSHVEGIGILRMTHRAATQNERVWYRDTVRACAQMLLWMRTVAAESVPQAVDVLDAFIDRAGPKDDNSM